MSVRDIPHGHGLSHKKGIADGLVEANTYANNLPNGHEQSYQRGRAEGEALRASVAQRVRPEPEAP